MRDSGEEEGYNSYESELLSAIASLQSGIEHYQEVIEGKAADLHVHVQSLPHERSASQAFRYHQTLYLTSLA